jgi:tetratricopeptide (TPR) repeat protein
MGVHHLTRTGRYREAEKYFRKVVDLESAKGGFSPEGQRSLIYLAIIYQSLGEYDRAEEHYQKFIGTDPDLENDLVLLNYNNDYLKRKDDQKTRSKPDI